MIGIKEREEASVKRVIEKYLGIPVDLGKVRLDQNKEDSTFIDSIVNAIVQFGDEDAKIWLWNNLEVHSLEGHSLTEESKAFLSEWVNTLYHPVNPNQNLNVGLYSERLIFKPFSFEEDNASFFQHVLDEGDFRLYTGYPLTEENINRFNYPLGYLQSFLLLKKDTLEPIGMVGLYDTRHNYYQVMSSMSLQYYLYKEYRGQGYMEEAIKILLDAFFLGKLRSYVSTRKRYIFEIKNAEPIVVKISTGIDNHSSMHLAERLGFVQEGTVYYDFAESPQPHSVSYYMDKAIYMTNKNA